MTEDFFGDSSADLGDDFSLASGIDEINYDDPFNSNHDNSDGLTELKQVQFVFLKIFGGAQKEYFTWFKMNKIRTSTDNKLYKLL